MHDEDMQFFTDEKMHKNISQVYKITPFKMNDPRFNSSLARQDDSKVKK
jgi:hypothetical protein